MPIYEYKCKDCDNDFEEIVSVNTQENPPCPKCCSNNTEKKMSVFGSIGGTTGSCSSSRFT